MSPVEAPAVEPLRDDLRSRAFGLSGAQGPLRVGLEVELLAAVDAEGRRLPLRSSRGPSILGLVRRVARRRGWVEGRTASESPRFRVPGAGAVSFEPGGQIEYSSRPRLSVDRVVEEARSVIEALRVRFREEGAGLRFRGMEPGPAGGPRRLELQSSRYRRLASHLERIGKAGRRMMLETAAIHVNLDLGERPLDRWRAANALMPSVIAAFANSSRYGGRETGFRSYRAQQWRELDPDRTGVFGPGAGVESYLEFALGAGAILLGDEDDEARPYREWLDGATPGPEAWKDHLSTLFPEVRPRGYLEIRAVDALPPRWLAAPLVFLAGLLYDSEALETARELLDGADRESLRRAGREGMGRADRADRCRELFDLALEGAARLGSDRVGGESLERTRAFRDRYPARGEDPAADPACGGFGAEDAVPPDPDGN